MQVILLQDVAGVGKRLDVKDISDGYALNKLIPRGFVREATPSALKQAEAEKVRAEAQRKVHEDLLVKNLSAVEDKIIHIKAKANEQGHLFAAIHENDVVKQLKEELHVDARPDFIKLPEHIKAVGEYKISIEVQGKKTQFTLVIESEK